MAWPGRSRASGRHWFPLATLQVLSQSQPETRDGKSKIGQTPGQAGREPVTESGAPKRRSEVEEGEMRSPNPSELPGPEEAGGGTESLPSLGEPKENHGLSLPE